MSVTSPMQFDLLALLFSGLVMEVALHVVPAPRSARRYPLLCLARVATGLGAVGLVSDALWEVHSSVLELAHEALVRLADALRSPPPLIDLGRLGSRILAGFLLLACAFHSVGKGFTTLAWRSRPATKDSEILESEGDQGAPYRSSGPVTRKVLRVDDEVPHGVEANVTSVTISVNELRKLLSTPGALEHQIRDQSDALPRRGTPKRFATTDPWIDSQRRSAPVEIAELVTTGVVTQGFKKAQLPTANAMNNG
ncbi:MAG: hypothetical protein KVP17_004723, partial [Porospora cf. gigantea B]|uniref:uncharacterized protein n=1 Tax=Porospora cf. gigantea B TaxID=2853592 RepID=UPI003571C3B9